jgi:LmbE family N-acetylglucosaminyl deacetylase
VFVASRAVAKVAAVLKEVAPSEVYVTSPFEAHPEHVAANVIVREARTAAGIEPTILEYTVSPRTGLPPPGPPSRRSGRASGRRWACSGATSASRRRARASRFATTTTSTGPRSIGRVTRRAFPKNNTL